MEFETLLGLENMPQIQCPPRGQVKEITFFFFIGQQLTIGAGSGY